MSNDHGWRGLTVRNLDGRTGTIRRESVGCLHLALTIAVDGDGNAQVQLNSNAKDSG